MQKGKEMRISSTESGSGESTAIAVPWVVCQGATWKEKRKREGRESWGGDVWYFGGSQASTHASKRRARILPLDAMADKDAIQREEEQRHRDGDRKESDRVGEQEPGEHS